MLPCRLSHSRLRHFLGNFRESHLSQLRVFLCCFPFLHTSWFHETGAIFWSIWIKRGCSGERYAVKLAYGRQPSKALWFLPKTLPAYKCPLCTKAGLEHTSLARDLLFNHRNCWICETALALSLAISRNGCFCPLMLEYPT